MMEVVQVQCSGPGSVVPGVMLGSFDNKGNGLSPCRVYQTILEASQADWILYLHDDVTIHDPDWIDRFTMLTYNPECVGIGFGGALGLGSADLYRKPYHISQLARRGYRSNQTDAEVHGEREEGDCRVAVLEQFGMALRADWLREHGGWPTGRLTHHMIDGWIACEAARSGKELWMSGVSCTHHGGGSSTTEGYKKAKWLQGHSLESDHQIPHRWIFDEYHDVLPLEVPR